MATFVQRCAVAVLRSVDDRTWWRLILGVRVREGITGIGASRVSYGGIVGTAWKGGKHCGRGGNAQEVGSAGEIANSGRLTLGTDRGGR